MKRPVDRNAELRELLRLKQAILVIQNGRLELRIIKVIPDTDRIKCHTTVEINEFDRRSSSLQEDVME